MLVEMTLREGSRNRGRAAAARAGPDRAHRIVGEGPLGRGGAWLLSARKSYLDLLIKQVSDDDNFAFGLTSAEGHVGCDVEATARSCAIVGRSKLTASQQHRGVNNPQGVNDVFWRRRLALAPDSTAGNAQRAAAHLLLRRNLARVVLDEGNSLTAAWRSDLTLVPSSRWSINAGGSVASGHDETASRRVIDLRAGPQLRQNASLDSTLGNSLRRARWSDQQLSSLRAPGSITGRGKGNAGRRRGFAGQLTLGKGLELVAGSGVYRQFPGFNEIAGIRGTPGLEPERAWHADVGVHRPVASGMRAQAVLYRRQSRDGIFLPGAGRS